MEFARNLNLYLYREILWPSKTKVIVAAMGELANNGYRKRASVIRNSPNILHNSLTKGFSTDRADEHELSGMTQEQLFDLIQILMDTGQALDPVEVSFKLQASCYKSPRPGRTWASLVTDDIPTRTLLEAERTAALEAAAEVNPELGTGITKFKNFMPHIRLGDTKVSDMIYEGPHRPYALGPIKGHITELGTDTSITGTLPILSHCLFEMETY